MVGYIYKIVNKYNDHFYIGSSLNIKKRQYTHFSKLKHNSHHCYHLQNAFNIYGADAFYFLIKKYDNLKDEKELRELEERYISYCWNSGKLYNSSKVAGGGDNITTLPKEKYDELIKLQSRLSKERWESKTEEEKKQYSEKYKGEKNPNYNHRWNEQQRRHLSEFQKEHSKTHPPIQKGRTFEDVYGEEKAKELKKQLSESASLRTGEKNPFYGRHHSEETRKLISEKNKGNECPTKKKVVYNGKIYDSAASCSNEIGICMGTVAYRCRNQLYGFAYYKDSMDINNILDTATSHKPYTKEEIYELASNFKTKQEFRNAYPGAVSRAKSIGVWDDICSKYFTELRHYWSLEEIIEIAKKYKTYNEFAEHNHKAHLSVKWNNWSEEVYKVCPKSNKKYYKRWSEEEIIKLAEQFDTFGNFVDHEYCAYLYAKKREELLRKIIQIFENK